MTRWIRAVPRERSRCERILRRGSLLGALLGAIGCSHSTPPATQPTQPPPAAAAPHGAPETKASLEEPLPTAKQAPTAEPVPSPSPTPAAPIAVSVSDPKAYVSQAEDQLQSGSNEVAIATAKRALQIDDRYAPAMVVIGQAEYNEGKIELARYALDQALLIDPHNADANNLYGMIDQTRDDLPSDQERIATAIKHFQGATQSNGDFAAAWNNLGAMYLKEKHFADAQQALEKAVAIRPNWAIAELNLGCAYRGVGLTTTDASQRDPMLQKAQQALERAAQLDPNNPDVAFDLGILYLDADPFPGLANVDRLQKVVDELTSYQQLMGPRLQPDDPTQGPAGYLVFARAQHEHEVKELERKARQKEKSGGTNGG